VGWALVEYSHTTSVDACAAACTRFPSEAEMQSIEGSVDFSVDPPFELDVDVRASFYTEGGSSFDVTLAAQMVPVGPC
jgi:hypothetical protein